MFTPNPKNIPSPGKSSWSGRRKVWLLPIFAPYATFPRPWGQIAAISRDWWWNPTKGPTRLDVTSPSAMHELGPRTLSFTMPFRSTRHESQSKHLSTKLIDSIVLFHCTIESRTIELPEIDDGSFSFDKSVTLYSAEFSTTALEPIKHPSSLEQNKTWAPSPMIILDTLGSKTLIYSSVCFV